MVKTPPYQKRGKCGHFMPQFDSCGSCFGYRTKCKGQDPCAHGADTTQCSACASLREEQWSHLRESFAKRSAYRQRTSRRVTLLRSWRQKNWCQPVKTSHRWMTLSWILNRKTPILVHLSPASALLLAYWLYYPHRMSRQLLLLWVQYSSLQLFHQPFSGCRTLCLRQSHRTFHLQDMHHTQLLAGNPLRTEWLLGHSHNHRGLFQQQRSNRLLGFNLLGAS